MQHIQITDNSTYGKQWNYWEWALCSNILLFFLVLTQASAQNKNAPIVGYECPSVALSCSLPSAYKVVKTHFTLSDYSTSALLSEGMHIPEAQALNANEDSTATALAIDCPEGSYALVFGMEGAFPSPQELQIRIEDLRRDYAQQRGINASDAFIMTSGGPVVLDGLAATEQILSTPVGEKDTLFTIITTAQAGSRVYGIIMRAKQSLAYKASTAARLSYLNILNNLNIDILYNQTTLYVNPESGYKLPVPTLWAGVTRRLLPDVFPTKEEQLSPKKKELPGAGRIIKDDTSLWNALVIQLPVVQIEIIVTGSHPRTEAALKEDATHLLKTSGTNADAAHLDIKKDIPVGSKKGTEIQYTISRRDDLTHYRLLVVYANGRKYLVRTISWERDLPAATKILNRLLKDFNII